MLWLLQTLVLLLDDVILVHGKLIIAPFHVSGTVCNIIGNLERG